MELSSSTILLSCCCTLLHVSQRPTFSPAHLHDGAPYSLIHSKYLSQRKASLSDSHGPGSNDSPPAWGPSDHRARRILLFSDWHHSHFRDFCIISEFSKTHQSSHLLRFLGKHALQHWHYDIRVWRTSWADIAFVPISGILNPNVRISQNHGSDCRLIQRRFVPADALWNLAMAINVYMTLFKKYNSQQLKALEWKYHLLCYGGPFIIALTLIFIETSSRGRVYGPAIVGQNESSEIHGN